MCRHVHTIIFFAGVVSRGGAPTETTYFISHNMGEDVDYLEFKEFSNLLSMNLKELGYTEQDSVKAHLDIHLNYYLGSKETVSTSATHSNSSVTLVNWNDNANKKSNTNTKTPVKAYNYGAGSTTTTIKSGYPCYLVLEAFNTVNDLPEWKVEIEGIIKTPTDLPRIMPWMMLVAKWHVGKNYSGKVEVKTKRFVNNYLPNIFSDTWLLQYNYFGSPDILYKEDPTK